MAHQNDAADHDSEVPESFRHPLRVASLATRKPTRFKLDPDAATRAAVAETLGLIELPRLRMKGELTPSGSRDFTLKAVLEASIVQPCSVTLAPVPSDLKEDVVRRFVADWHEPEGDDVEMPEDDSAEPLPDVIDLGHVAIEALALALPLYPRAPGAELGDVNATPPGAEPILESDMKPFAGLAALKAKLENPE
ncbi:YceD family protein [Thioclava sp. FR2]|uniref:YceD family protein n=1 Tax=Thioclava sp. FR2 TaxID=3445780 RepID=UPI003EC12C53